jgi:hypothetical protein
MNRPQRVLTSVLIATILVLDASQARSQTVPLTASSPAPVSTAPPSTPGPTPAPNHTMAWVQAAIGAVVVVLVVGSVVQANKCHHANDCTYPSTDYTPVFDDATKRHPAFQLGLRIPLGIIPLAASERR